jgi:hypothetical protein
MGNVAVEAKTCELLDLFDVVRDFKTKYEIWNYLYVMMMLIRLTTL